MDEGPSNISIFLLFSKHFATRNVYSVKSNRKVPIWIPAESARYTEGQLLALPFQRSTRFHAQLTAASGVTSRPVRRRPTRLYIRCEIFLSLALCLCVGVFFFFFGGWLLLFWICGRDIKLFCWIFCEGFAFFF